MKLYTTLFLFPFFLIINNIAKISLNKKIGNFFIYFFITKTQKAVGISSQVPDSDNHYVLWDFDNVSDFTRLVSNLETIKNNFGLGDILIFSDKLGSYRAISFTQVDFKKLLKILIVTPNLDLMFFKWTVKRGYATIRISDKKMRKPNHIVKILTDMKGEYDFSIIPDYRLIDYETDLDGKVINL